MRDDPLVIFCSPRGGSSLVASAFVNHGFWVGETFGGPDGRGNDVYVTHENAAIKQFMKGHWPLDAGNHSLNARRGDLLKACRRIVPLDQIWLFKGVSEYYGVWRHYFPNMRAVMVFRDRTQAVEAHVRRRGEKVREIASQVVTQRYKFMDTVLKYAPLAFRVDADRLVSGDTTQLDPILEEYAIKPDHRLAMKSIDSSIFHQ